jgi:hypothetical protein
MTVSRSDVEATLQRAGSRPAPKPTAAFVAGLEARLMSSADAVPGPVVAVADASPSRSHARIPHLVPVLSAVAAAVAAVVLAGALSGWFAGGGSENPTLVSAHDTTVVLPSGRSVEGKVGLELPDGALVQTGPDGSATAGGVEIGPDTQATVNNGQVQTTPTLPTVTIPTLPTVPSLPVTAPTIPSLP